jgi:hypothetical protein
MRYTAAALTALLTTSVLPVCAHAQTPDDIAQIRQQIQQMKLEYEARINDLEKRLAAAEAKSAAPPPAPAASAPAPEASASAASSAHRGNAFNPDISVVLQGRYANLSEDPNTYRIGGFIPPGSDVGPGKRGLSLSESELFISANADPYFSGTLAASLAPDDTIAVENAYLQTIALSNGFTARAGRFFSDVGYLNAQHQHAWDFIDAPLPYRAFLGGQLGDDGVQLKWLAPTELYLELGAEAGRGRGFPGSDRNKNGISMGTAFAHAGGDIGDGGSWRGGLSFVRTSPDGRAYQDADSTGDTVTNAFTGTSKLWIADFTAKWAPSGNVTATNFKFQTEYFRRREDGTLTFDTPGRAVPGAYASDQSGWYALGVYQFQPNWRVGARYDRLSGGGLSLGSLASGELVPGDLPILAPYNPVLATAMIDWMPSEFSLLRLQYARDKSRPGEADNQIFLQYILSLGAHGAHKW